MRIKTTNTTFIHRTPNDLRIALTSNKDTLRLWDTLTPLARNEWICWVTIVKKDDTRAEHIKRLCAQLQDGKKRPCCWPGCPHRKPDTQKWFRNKSTTK